MFKKQIVGIAALTFLSEEIRALKLKNKFRPIPGTVPWHDPATRPSWEKPTWPVNYFVPDFGVDTDIKSSRINEASAEKRLGTKMHANFKDDEGVPRSYFVPDFGVDDDVQKTQKSILAAESGLGAKLHADFGDNEGVNRNYFVPNFGEDQDIVATQSNIVNAEKKLGKSMTATFKDNEGVPRNYFVPDFGLDQDIQSTQKNIALEEKRLGAPWSPVQDDNGYWLVPSNVQLESQVALDSDPICSSAGCEQYMHPKKDLGYEINYPVPDFGVDNDISDSHNSEKAASSQLGHKWVWVEPKEKKAPYIPPSLGVDEDIVNVQHAIKNQEAKHGAWKPVQDENGYWLLPGPIDNNSYSYSAVQLDSEMEDESVFLNVNGELREIKAPASAEKYHQTLAQAKSDPICDSSGCNQYKFPEPPEDYPKDYPVPNLGQDRDIADSLNHERMASKMVGHQWEFKTDASWEKWRNKAKDTLYNYHPSLDGDIITTNKNQADAEAKHGAWDLVQTESDPICSSQGCPKSEYVKAEEAKVIQYPDPSVLDSDINSTLQHEEAASEELGHNWKIIDYSAQNKKH